MNKIYNPNKNSWSTILKRPTQTVEAIEGTVLQVFNEVETEGDAAVARYTEKFDKVSLDTVLVTDTEINNAREAVSADLKKAIALAKSNSILLARKKSDTKSWFIHSRRNGAIIFYNFNVGSASKYRRVSRNCTMYTT